MKTTDNIQGYFSPREVNEAMRTAQDERDNLRKQRDAAVAALRDCVTSLEWTRNIIRDIPEKSAFNENIETARAAIAAAEKGQ